MLERAWLGRRVTVRRVLERRADGGLQFGDVVGDLVGLDEQTATVETRHGLVDVPVALVTVAKLVPPSTAEELALAGAVAQSWRPAETSQVGGWLLRAADGFTGRANSVLPLRAPGMPLDEALAAARAWYLERGLPLRLQIPTEARRLLDAELGERGWPASPDIHVMTARLDMLPAASAGQARVELADAPSQPWLRRFRNGVGVRPAARGVLTRHPHVVFASVTDSRGDALAIGRGTVDGDWLGVTAVEVAPEHRRAGLAGAVTRELWRWGAAAGAVRTHLQVAAENLPARALYEGLGYHTHHYYRYRSEPAGTDVPSGVSAGQEAARAVPENRDPG